MSHGPRRGDERRARAGRPPGPWPPAVRTITYRTPRACMSRTPTAASLFVVAQLAHRVRRLLRHRGRRSGSGTASCRTPRRTGPPSSRCSRRSSAAAASAPSSCRTCRCPRCSPTAPGRSRGRVLAEALHRLHDVVVLGVVLAAALVAGEVVPGPTVAERVGVGLGRAERAPRVHRLVAVGLDRVPSPGSTWNIQPRIDQHDERGDARRTRSTARCRRGADARRSRIRFHDDG